MTNPNDAIGTNAAYGTRTSVNAFNDIVQLVNGRGTLSGFAVVPKSGMVLTVGGSAGTRDVAIAEDNLGNRTCINNRLAAGIDVEIAAAGLSSNRYDAIVVYANNPAQADDTTPDAPSVCGIIAVQGGTTGVSDAQIRTAITADGGTGSIAYYATLATILVPTGATTITSGNITQNHVAISAADIADGEITGNMLANNTITRAKVDATSYAATADGNWTVSYLPNGKKMWVQSGNWGPSGSFTPGGQNYAFVSNIATLPSALADFSGIHIIGTAQSTSQSCQCDFVWGNSAVGGSDKFGLRLHEWYGTGSVTRSGTFSLILIEK